MAERVRNVREALEVAARRVPDKVFVYFEEHAVTYREFDRITGQVANAFRRRGIGKGDKVALYLPNGLEFLYTWFGLMKIGAVMVPINTFFRARETQYVLENSDARLAVITPEQLPMFREIRGECPMLEGIVSTADAGGDAIPFYEWIAGEEAEVPPVDLRPDDDAAILYTSGTTGHPKGCVEPQSYYVVNPQLWYRHLGLNRDDRLLTPLPLFHMNPQILSTMSAILLGASLVLVDRFHPTRWWDQVRAYGATQFNYLGVMPAMLWNLPPSPADRDHRVRVAMGAGIPHRIHAAFEERFGIRTVEAFGMTETGVNFLVPLEGDRHLGTGCMGRLLAGFEARVVDEQERDVPPGEMGELVLRYRAGPEGSAMMKGYYKNPEATAEAWRGGWFHTGDFVRRDEEGFYYFVDRKKDIVRRSGENISSMEVEDCVRSHPAVAHAPVGAQTHHLRGEEVRVAVILKPGETPETCPPESIVRWCEERLAYFKVPRYVEYRQDFPRTASEKVQKSALKRERPLRLWDRVTGRFI
ncbi:MAG: ATP-dependent acyl-CoA ligase, partial [Clostridia bacterium]|nr:ATP-dependent acyl-CoA ligase [Clostridia bacterium]